MKPDDVASIAASVSALAAIGTACLAAYSLMGSRADSRDRTRPMIVARLTNENLASGTTVLHVKNYGATSARNVRLVFDPPIKNLEDLPVSDNWHWIGMRYSQPIANWPPGMILGNIVRDSREETSPFTVQVAYEGLDGRGYHEHFRLDPRIHFTETHSNLDEDAKFEKTVTRALFVIARNIDRELG